MIKKLDWVAIWSEDLHNLLPFYRDTLGLRVVEESSGYVALQGGDDGLRLCLGTHREVSGQANDPFRHMVGFATDDLDTDFQRLSSAGVLFVENPSDYPGFRMATLTDPEGNLVQLYQGGELKP